MNIDQDTKEALSVALGDLLNATKIGNERMRLFALLRDASPSERPVILMRIQGLRDRIKDAEILLKLYVG